MAVTKGAIGETSVATIVVRALITQLGMPRPSMNTF